MTVAAEGRSLPRYVTVLLVALIMLAGIGGAVALVKGRPKPKREKESVVAPPVEVMGVRVGNHRALLRLQGNVRPARQLVVVSEVGGRVRWHNRNLVPGGIIKKGETLLRIDARDYLLAVRQQAAQVANQRLALRIEQGRSKVAQREWELFQQQQQRLGIKTGDGKDAPALVSRKPHLASAKVAVRSARSALARAQLALSKTTLVAPFNAFVQNENVEIGQLVSPQMQLATLVGTDVAWIQASIPVAQLGYIRFPSAGEQGSRARIWSDTGQGRIERQGRVIRLLGDLDPGGRMARVLIEVRRPFPVSSAQGARPATNERNAKSQKGPASVVQPKAEGHVATKSDPPSSEVNNALPLLMGSFVHVEISGGELKNVIELPRSALRNDDVVHVLAPGERLRIVPVKVVWGSPNNVWVRGAIASGDRIIVTQLGAAISGMKLRVVSKPTARAPGAAAPSSSARAVAR